MEVVRVTLPCCSLSKPKSMRVNFLSLPSVVQMMFAGLISR